MIALAQSAARSTGTAAAINRALLWKEARTQRPVLFAGVAVVAIVPGLLAAALSTERPYAGFDVVRMLPVVLAALWPFLAVAAGALCFAGEAEGNTERFLLSRPASRLRLWSVKVAAALLTLIVSGALSVLMVGIAGRLAGSPEPGYRITLGIVDMTLFEPFTIAAAGLVFFGCSLVCSTQIDRSLTAAAAAVAASLAVLAGVLLVWSTLALVPQLEPQWLGLELFVVAALLATISLVLYCWPEQFALRDARAGVAGRAAAGGATLLSLCAGVLPLLFAALTPRAEEVRVVPGTVSFNGDAVLMEMRDSGGGSEAWVLMVDGSGMRPLTGRHTLAPHWPQGDALLTYYSRRGMFGAGGTSLDLRLTDSSGVLSRLVYPAMPGVRELFFRDGGLRGSAAFVDDGRLHVVSLDGHERRTLDLAGSPLHDAMLVGFVRRSPERLLFVSGNVDAATATLREDGALLVYALDSGEVRPLLSLPAGSTLPGRLRNTEAGAQGARGGGDWQSLPMIVVESTSGGGVGTESARPGERRASAGTVVGRVDLSSGKLNRLYEMEIVGSTPDARRAFERCNAVEPAADRSWRDENGRSYRENQVVFADCSETTRSTLADGAIRLVGAGSGNVETWPLPSGWQGTVHRIHLAPGQRTVLLDIRRADPAGSQAMTLEAGGAPRTYAAGWIPLGWSGPEHFLLQSTDPEDVRFAIGEPRTGQLHELYPDNQWREVLAQRAEEMRRKAPGAAPEAGR